jgi:hypothetical protein
MYEVAMLAENILSWFVTMNAATGAPVGTTALGSAAVTAAGAAATQKILSDAGKVPAITMPKMPSILTGEYAAEQQGRRLKAKKGKFATLLTDPDEFMRLGSPNIRKPRLGD